MRQVRAKGLGHEAGCGAWCGCPAEVSRELTTARQHVGALLDLLRNARWWNAAPPPALLEQEIAALAFLDREAPRG
jgi:hypothetical protein